MVSSNSEVQKAKTLDHEIGHALLHDPESVTTKDLTRGLKELEVESTAYVICTALGVEVAIGPSVEFGQGELALDVVVLEGREYRRAVDAVLLDGDRLEEEMAEAVSAHLVADGSDGLIEVSADLSAIHAPDSSYQPFSGAELEALDFYAEVGREPDFGKE